MSDNYRTVKKETSAEFTERRSRFIGSISPVETEEDALTFISKVKKQYSDAKHNVYAYVLRSNNIMRYSDDGEPQGTAGMPSLDVLRKESLTDVAVVVTRYFGGILLGGGGLVRAYSRAVKEAVDASGIVNMETRKIFMIEVPYPLYDSVQKCIEECDGTISKAEFFEKISIEFALSEKNQTDFDRRLADATNGAIQTKLIGEKYVGTED